MKKARLSVYLDPEMMTQLAALADQKRQPKSLIAEAAITAFLTPMMPIGARPRWCGGSTG
jgi:predicted transcriptional regulator